MTFVPENETFIGTIVGHISAFHHIVDYFGTPVEARLHPGVIADVNIGDRVVVKPYPNGGFNLIISGPIQENLHVCIQNSGNTVGFSGTSEFQEHVSFPDHPWTRIALPVDFKLDTAQSGFPRPEPYCLTKDLWFVAHVGGFNNPNSASIGSSMNLAIARSQDGGFTWDQVSVGDETPFDINQTFTPSTYTAFFSRIDINASRTRLWAVRKKVVSNATSLEIFCSDDRGDTWTHSLSTSSSRMPIRILCHPTNDNIIIVCAHDNTSTSFYGDGRVTIISTIDNGANWTTNISSSFEPSDSGGSNHWQLLPTNRIVCYNGGGDGAVLSGVAVSVQRSYQVWTSDDYGATWTLRFRDPYVEIQASMGNHESGPNLQAQHKLWKSGGRNLIAYRNRDGFGSGRPPGILESIDYGITWTERDVGRYHGGFSGEGAAVIYDPFNDALIAALYGHFDFRDRQIFMLRDATKGGIDWENVSGDYAGTSDKSINAVSSNSTWNSIALIPRG